MKKITAIFLVIGISILSGCSLNKEEFNDKTNIKTEDVKYTELEKEVNQLKKENDSLKKEIQILEQNQGVARYAQEKAEQGKIYQLKPMYPETNDYTKWYEQKLVKISKEEVIIENIKEVLPELKGAYNLALTEFAYPADSKFIFFRSALMETNNPGGLLYSFDTKNRVFKKMDIGFSDFDGFALSPDNTRFAFAPNNDTNGLDQVLFICSLLNDSCEEKIKLTGNETFNGGNDGISGDFEIAWIDDSKIEYSVFDQDNKYQESNKETKRYLDL